MMTTTRDSIFEGLLQNLRYVVVRANNVVFEFTITDFLLMNLNDLIAVKKILGFIDV